MDVYNSDKKNKRFVAIFSDGTETDFGLKNGSTYIDHGDKKKRTNYISRHKPNENWDDYTSAGSLSRFILWGDNVDIHKNIDAFKKRFNLN